MVELQNCLNTRRTSLTVVISRLDVLQKISRKRFSTVSGTVSGGE